MSISAGALAAITGGSSIASNLIQNSGTKRSQKRADKMNIKFFDMQNEYNTPEAQMARLKKAGLNPNLVSTSSDSGEYNLNAKRSNASITSLPSRSTSKKH